MGTWTQTLLLFGAKQKTVQDFLSDLLKDRCTEEVKVGQKNGAVFAACPVQLSDGTPCSECPDPMVVKVSKRLLNPRERGAEVGVHEALVLRDIHSKLDALPAPWAAYRKCVLAYVNHTQGLSTMGFPETVLVSKLVPRKRGDPRNLRDFLRSGRCTAKDLLIIIIQVFMTLDLLQSILPGFVHMDLLTPQIFLRRWPTTTPATLPVNATTSFVLPVRRFWSVLGDFGTAVTQERPQAALDYRFNEQGPGFVCPAQDVFRFFMDTHHSTRNTGLEAFVDSLVLAVFGRQFEELVRAAEAHSKGILYLPANVASRLPFQRYSQVLDHLPVVNQFLKKN